MPFPKEHCRFLSRAQSNGKQYSPALAKQHAMTELTTLVEAAMCGAGLLARLRYFAFTQDSFIGGH